MEYRNIFTQNTTDPQCSQVTENMTVFPSLLIVEEEEHEFLIKIKAGDLSARRELILI